MSYKSPILKPTGQEWIHGRNSGGKRKEPSRHSGKRYESIAPCDPPSYGSSTLETLSWSSSSTAPRLSTCLAKQHRFPPCRTAFMVGYDTRIYEPPSEKGHLIREVPKVTPLQTLE